MILMEDKLRRALKFPLIEGLSTLERGRGREGREGRGVGRGEGKEGGR